MAFVGAAAQTGTVPLDSGTAPSGFTNSDITESNGNVGIGTTNPQTKLEINDNLRFTADSSIQTTAWTGVLRGGDCAEAMSAACGKKKYEPGYVLVLADGDDNDVQKA